MNPWRAGQPPLTTEFARLIYGISEPRYRALIKGYKGLRTVVRHPYDHNCFIIDENLPPEANVSVNYFDIRAWRPA